jgi:hypothetical protein
MRVIATGGLAARAGVVAASAVALLVPAVAANAAQTPAIAWSPATSAGTYNFGTPAAGQPASQKTFTLANSGGSATSALTIAVTGPAFTKAADSCTGISLGAGKSCTVTVSYAVPAKPSQHDTGTLTATANKPPATASLTLVGASANVVSVTSPAGQASTAGTAVSLQIQAADSDPGQSLTYSAAGLPAGLSISSATGLISGTPTTAGTFNATVTATDTTGASGSAPVTWTVSPAPNTITVVNPGDQIGGGNFSLQIQASDSDPGQTLTYSAPPRGLPAELSINSATGLISGYIPTDLGGITLSVAITVTDTTGASGRVGFNIFVPRP